MQRWLFVVLAACGSSPATPDARAIDATVPDSVCPSFPDDSCNVLMQTGCPVGYKCTWLIDQYAPQPLGHIDCRVEGSAQLGEPCSFGPIQPCSAVDDCARGLYCDQGVCRTICDPNGGAPACEATSMCVTHTGEFGPVGQPVAAGVCEPM